VFGVLTIGLLISASAWLLSAGDLERQGLFFTFAAAFALTFRLAWEFPRYVRYAEGGMSDAVSATVMTSLLLGAYLVFHLIRRPGSRGTVTFLFCALLARWYFDLFYGFMSKALFFSLGGILLLSTAFAYRMWERAERKRGGGHANP
jgi:uncharacterized membrane protein